MPFKKGEGNVNFLSAQHVTLMAVSLDRRTNAQRKSLRRLILCYTIQIIPLINHELIKNFSFEPKC